MCIRDRYHTVHEFQNLNLEDRLNLFHSNINGLECKFETLCAFLTYCKSPPNLIGVTETSEQKDSSFITKVTIEGYNFYHTPTTISKGGCCIYVKNDFDVFERDDLKVQNDHFQSVWTEIKNKKSKNIIFGCIYRSPNKKHDVVDFLTHFDSILKKVSKENKEIYICGDFNIDLLQIDKGS